MHVPLPCPGKKNKVRVYYLAWLRNKILHNDPEVEKKQGWTTVGEMEALLQSVALSVTRLTHGNQ